MEGAGTMATIELISGGFAPVPTPIAPDGAVDEGALRRHLRWLAESGLDGAVVLGSNGEFPSFTLEERRRIAAAASAARGSLTMILGVGSCAIGEVIEMVGEAARLGYDAVLCPPPFYFRKPSTRGLVEFFGRVLDTSRVPVLAYHIPHLTGIPIDDELLDLIGGHPRLAGVKDSTGDPSELRRLVGRCAGRSYLVGSDRLVLAAREAGSSGSITAAASIVPGLVADAARSSHGQEALTRVRGLLEEFGLQAAVKALLRHRGFGYYGSRPPLVGLEAEPERSAELIRRFEELSPR
jgi:4-hydroxy-tetrahydrodipicolinate synthase